MALIFGISLMVFSLTVMAYLIRKAKEQSEDECEVCGGRYSSDCKCYIGSLMRSGKGTASMAA